MEGSLISQTDSAPGSIADAPSQTKQGQLRKLLRPGWAILKFVHPSCVLTGLLVSGLASCAHGARLQKGDLRGFALMLSTLIFCEHCDASIFCCIRRRGAGAQLDLFWGGLSQKKGYRT